MLWAASRPGVSGLGLCVGRVFSYYYLSQEYRQGFYVAVDITVLSMSSFEMPNTWQGGDELQGLTVETYSDRSSVYWDTDTDYNEAVELFYEAVLPLAEDSQALLEAEEGSAEGSLEDVLEADPTNPEMLVVYAPHYGLSWERSGSSNEVGISLEKPDPRLVKNMFESTTGESLDYDTADEIAIHIAENVDG